MKSWSFCVKVVIFTTRVVSYYTLCSPTFTELPRAGSGLFLMNLTAGRKVKIMHTKL